MNGGRPDGGRVDGGRTVPRILVTGASGFIGHWVVAALRQRGVAVRALGHLATVPVLEGVETVRGDLCEPVSLRGLCRGVEAVVHCASEVGPDADRCHRVNVGGTRALLAEAARHGVDRVVYVSTAAVYGRGPFRGASPAELPLSPQSPAGRTRAEAEQRVLDHEGTVLRPHLVYGAGDRWLVDGVRALRRATAPGAEAPSTRHSLVDVRDLAAAVAATVLRPTGLGGVHHINHPVPVGYRELDEQVRHLLGPDLLGGTQPPGGTDPARLRQLRAMAGVDHWFANSPAWADLDCVPSRSSAQGLAEHGPWYRDRAERLGAGLAAPRNVGPRVGPRVGLPGQPTGEIGPGRGTC